MTGTVRMSIGGKSRTDSSDGLSVALWILSNLPSAAWPETGTAAGVRYSKVALGSAVSDRRGSSKIGAVDGLFDEVHDRNIDRVCRRNC